MKGSTMFAMLAAIYTAPHLPWWLGLPIAGVCLVMGLRALGRDGK